MDKKRSKQKREYVFKEKSRLDHYKADAFVVRCIDSRFWRVAKHFIKSIGLKHVDPPFPAGGAKVFASPFDDYEAEHYLRQLAISIKLHHTERVMLFSHHDCGAYGGFANFANDSERELEFHRSEHEKAIRVIRERFPQVSVETYFIDAKGIIKTS